jgi:GntR family transcriptional regulator/MocR family aminotransferase
MTKKITSYELTLRPCKKGQTLTAWLYAEVRQAILDGRLGPGTRLPSSRDFSEQYGLSRGTTVSAFERLQSEGYLSYRVGSGTIVDPLALSAPRHAGYERPDYIRRVASNYKRPRAWVNIVPSKGVRPFQMRDGACEEFPAKLWGTIAQRERETFHLC